MNPRVRKAALAAAFLGTLGLVVAEYRNEQAESQGRNAASPAARGSQAKTGEAARPPGAQSQALALPERPELGESRGDLFSPRSWEPPPSKVAPAPPPAPVAPPMPYRFAGKLVRGDEYSVMLSKGDLVFPITPGETIDGTYRVESVGEDTITLTYLPLRQKATIPIASELPGAPSSAGVQPTPSPQQTATPARAARGRAAPGPAAPTAAPAAAPAAAAPADPANTPPAADGGTARLHWEGPQRVRLGARFDVMLKLTSGQPLAASPMQLRFDPEYLELIGMKAGKYFGNDERNFSYRSSPDGSIYVGASNQNPAPATDAELLVLTFRPVKPAPAAELTMASLNLHGPAGRPIAFSQLESFKTAIAP